MKTVGIIGNGFVGNAIHQNLKDRVEVKVYDVDHDRSPNTKEDVLDCDYIFICLPTPMTEGGNCDVSYLAEFFKELPTSVKGTFVIKSTVPIGFSRYLASAKWNLKIVHNPEFLTANNSVEDFINCDRNVFGGPEEDTKDVRDFLYGLFPEWENVPSYLVSFNESEMIKYFSNSFLAFKIAYFNSVYETCNNFDSDYEVVRKAICDDDRINAHHTKVPGPDGELGFGGACLPKDINALINTLKQKGIDSSMFESVWNYNLKLRKENEFEV
jgi:UDPglucose 6-dehydrogenase|tara:strand:+ start:919 stop:1728 length:810 start_codon:yes stop_codon:yes gene_type:complete